MEDESVTKHLNAVTLLCLQLFSQLLEQKTRFSGCWCYNISIPPQIYGYY